MNTAQYTLDPMSQLRGFFSRCLGPADNTDPFNWSYEWENYGWDYMMQNYYYRVQSRVYLLTNPCDLEVRPYQGGRCIERGLKPDNYFSRANSAYYVMFQFLDLFEVLMVLSQGNFDVPQDYNFHLWKIDIAEDICRGCENGWGSCDCCASEIVRIDISRANNPDCTIRATRNPNKIKSHYYGWSDSTNLEALCIEHTKEYLDKCEYRTTCPGPNYCQGKTPEFKLIGHYFDRNGGIAEFQMEDCDLNDYDADVIIYVKAY